MSNSADFFPGSSGGGFITTPMTPKLISGWSGSLGDDSLIPVARSGQNAHFSLPSSISGSLLLVNAETGSTIATIAATAVIANGQWCDVFYYDSSDQGLYVLVKNSSAGTYQLARISDTTGSVTTIGTAFAVTTGANWPTTSTINGAGFASRFGTSLTIRFRTSAISNVQHVLNITTGEIVSQDGLATVNSVAQPAFAVPLYITADGKISISDIQFQSNGLGVIVNNLCDGTYRFGSARAVGGVMVNPGEIFGAPLKNANASCFIRMIDTDTVVITRSSASGTGDALSRTVYPRTELDRVLADIKNFYKGV